MVSENLFAGSKTVVAQSFVRFQTNLTNIAGGRRGSLMVSALDFGSGGPGSSPGRGTALCFWARYFTFIVALVALSTQAPAVQKVDNTIHRINRYPVDKYRQNKPRYPLDSDLSGG